MGNPKSEYSFASVALPTGNARYLSSGRGPTLLLVHGLPGRPQDFRWLFSPLQEHFHLLSVSLPGMGITPIHPDLEKGFPGQIRFLEDFIDALAVEKLSIVGHSFGGALAASLASLPIPTE